MCLIVEDAGQLIPEDCAGFVKAYAMFPQIGRSLPSIPFKLYTHTDLLTILPFQSSFQSTVGDAEVVSCLTVCRHSENKGSWSNAFRFCRTPLSNHPPAPNRRCRATVWLCPFSRRQKQARTVLTYHFSEPSFPSQGNTYLGYLGLFFGTNLIPAQEDL
jgi:hypothetical protein